MISSQSIAPLLIGEGAFFVEDQERKHGKSVIPSHSRLPQTRRILDFLDLRNLPNISSAQITGSSGCKLSEIIYVHIL